MSDKENMRKESTRILFMGTPEFAVASLKALVENGYSVAGVVTMPDKPAGRGYALQPSPVKQYALQQGLLVLQPEKLKEERFLNELKQLQIDLQIVVAFRMLPEVVWSMPPLGTFNLHSSLLPQYRGAAPINWAIINGEKETGVTTFFLSHEIDTGKVIFREKTTIDETDNAGILHDRLMVMGARLVLKTADAVLYGNVHSIPQTELTGDVSALKPAPKIFKEECRVDWNKSVWEIYNLIRGLSPYPAAWTELQPDIDGEKIRFKLFAGQPVGTGGKDLPPGTAHLGQIPPFLSGSGENGLQPGSIITDRKTFLDVVTGNGILRITELQPSGKRRMNAVDFLHGYHLHEHALFS